MAKIKNIEFSNFRNFKYFKTTFNNNLNIFFGDNGSGKTNILEGISLIAKGRGIRNSNISNLIKNKKENFKIRNTLEIQKNNFDVEIYANKNNDKYKKIIKINDDTSKESLDYLNNSVSFLTFLPEMERLFQTSPIYRRNFLDRLIFSGRNDYNKLINKYKKYLFERNKILQNDSFDTNWLNQIEKDISKIGFEIYESRYLQLKLLNSNLNSLENSIKFKFSISFEMKDIFFDKNLNIDKYILKLKDTRHIDKASGGTKIGPHKSDFLVSINDGFEASLLSTGQQKTIVLMMLLAQCNLLIKEKNITPILLLDEIGSHLDINNRKLILDMINEFDIQFFLTGTEKNLFSFVSTNAKFYNISNI